MASLPSRDCHCAAMPCGSSDRRPHRRPRLPCACKYRTPSCGHRRDLPHGWSRMILRISCTSHRPPSSAAPMRELHPNPATIGREVGWRTSAVWLDAVSDAVNTRGAWWAGVALLSAALLAPLLIADVPPLLDYPNHLARFVLLAAGPDDPTLGPIFTPHWAIIPNLATDVIGPPLLRLLPVHVAGRCLLGGILLLNLAGVLALHRALFGRRSFWPLASGLVAYNSRLSAGLPELADRQRPGDAVRRGVADLARAPSGRDHCGGGGGVGRVVLLSPDGVGVLPGADRQRRGARHVARAAPCWSDRRRCCRC